MPRPSHQPRYKCPLPKPIQKSCSRPLREFRLETSVETRTDGSRRSLKDTRPELVGAHGSSKPVCVGWNMQPRVRRDRTHELPDVLRAVRVPHEPDAQNIGCHCESRNGPPCCSKLRSSTTSCKLDRFVHGSISNGTDVPVSGLSKTFSEWPIRLREQAWGGGFAIIAGIQHHHAGDEHRAIESGALARPAVW